MKIEPLPLNVRSYLRSGVAITSVTQCVEELVLNSLDAGASCVAVRIDLNCFKVQVVDNGSGVPNDQLEILGNRFCTSKCHTIEDLDNLCHFGYRGEALASIRDSCGIFEITTRSKLSNKTYCKIFQNGKSLKAAESTIVRPSVGTTITVHELFSNFPVRQKSMNKNLEMERIKEMLEGVALIRPEISFTLRNDSTGQMVLSTRKCVSVNSTFGQLYGSTKADMLVEVKGSKETFHVHGYVGREGHQRKNLQFIYINGRIVKKSKIHKLLNKLLLNLPALKPKQRAPSNSPQMLGIKQNLFSSPPKFSEVYPVYVLEIKCPISEYDITFEPAKTMVEFKDWDTVLDCVEEITTSFLNKENIVVKSNEVESRNFKVVDVTQEIPVISADNMKDVLSSKMVKKVTYKTNINRMMEDTDKRNSNEADTSESSKETDAFKTPTCNTNVHVAVKSVHVMGLGNRNIRVDTETESENDTTVTTNDISSTDESFDSEKQKTKLQNQQCQKVENKNLDREHGFKHTTKSSLSVFRQSIGKFTGKALKKVNIDESLKKLDRIMPSSAKPSSKTLFSSLQKFRRRVGVEKTAADTEMNHKQEETFKSQDAVEYSKERYVDTLHRDNSDAMSKECVNHHKRNTLDMHANEVKLTDISKEQEVDDIIRKTYVKQIPSTDYTESKTSNAFQNEQFQFMPCYEKVKEDSQNSHDITDRVEALIEGEPIIQTFEVQDKRNPLQNESLVPEKIGIAYNTGECQSVPFRELCLPDSDKRLTDDNSAKSTRSERKRTCQDSDSSPAPEKQFKYTARPVALKEVRSELIYNQTDCDKIDDMCNKTDSDKVDMINEIIQTPEEETNKGICDNVDVKSDLPHLNTHKTELVSEKHFHSEVTNEEMNMLAAYKNKSNDVIASTNDELEGTEMNGFIASTQGFTPRLSPLVDICPEENENISKIKTPESLGFSPKCIIETDTPCSMGFDPSESIVSSVEPNIEMNEELKAKDFKESSKEDTEINSSKESFKMEFETCKLDQKEHLENKVLNREDEIIVSTNQENKIISGTCSESVTITQLLKTPSQQTEDDRNGSNGEFDSAIKENEIIESKRNGFSFGDLFSQTPSYSGINANYCIDAGKMNTDNRHDRLSNACSDCESVTINKNMSSTSKSAENEDKMDISDVDSKSEVKDADVTLLEVNDDIWSDSPWNISDSSFYLRDDMKQKGNTVTGGKEHGGTDGHDDSEGLTTVETEGPIETFGEKTIFNDQNLSTIDSLNAWYKNLDAVKTGASDILQSSKPSDVVRKLHACRFSKDSLKSVKVLGQMDKKFIACLINTEQHGANTDMTMLVLIDQHAAHERIRLEILTEDAFEGGMKGGQLAPFVVDPPQSMTFAEHEIKTIQSFLDGYEKLGIKMKKDTATSMLISSVPASLVDREKNNKIYWSTIQVLIREHISVFMSTQISCGVLPQTIHKVLCSLACHGAIKFGDKLAADECDKLIKDLSRCDLPFQCAHGRPSVTPLFQIDKLKSLSCSKHQAKPKLWKLKQAAMNTKSS